MDSSDKALVWAAAIVMCTIVALYTAQLIQDTIVETTAIKAGLQQQLIGDRKIWTKEGCK